MELVMHYFYKLRSKTDGNGVSEITEGFLSTYRIPCMTQHSDVPAGLLV